MNRRRRVIIAVAVAIVALALAPQALAAAGGGSSGFGGGGGGGGGGGHGSGFAIYLLLQLLFRIALLGHGLGALFLIGVALLYFLLTRVVPHARSSGASGPRAKRRTAKRERRVELAAAVAAEEDPAFAPDAVRANAAALFKQVQAAWSRGDRAALSRMVGPDLLTEWERRLDDLARRGWENHIEVLGEPTVEYVGLNHRGEQSDNVTVRIEAKLRDYVTDRYGNHMNRAGRLSEIVRLREFWTLQQNNQGRWVLTSIEQGAEGTHVLDENIVADALSDDAGMRDETLVEQAVADAVPEGTTVAEVADLDYEGDARAAALDLSLADGRFAPDVLEITARRAAKAWAEAVDGDDARLRSIAHGQAVRDLLHPGDPSEKTRLVVRGPEVRRIRIVNLDAGSQPPTMTVEVELHGRRYIEDRDTTAILAGSQSRATTFTERWTFALDGDARQPWLLTAVGGTVPQA
ncbi:MAG TPA: Tim44-like domain-containing protein [Solirubrobacteraceae bacterium]|nr:Tim44-like domain-containing protein [Solirubrobacteraceae bacterium]